VRDSRQRAICEPWATGCRPCAAPCRAVGSASSMQTVCMCPMCAAPCCAVGLVSSMQTVSLRAACRSQVWCYPACMIQSLRVGSQFLDLMRPQPLQTLGRRHNLRKAFEVLAAVVKKVTIFWDIAPCTPYVNRRFGGVSRYEELRRSSFREMGIFFRVSLRY
jgi:hypothetical protein